MDLQYVYTEVGIMQYVNAKVGILQYVHEDVEILKKAHAQVGILQYVFAEGGESAILICREYTGRVVEFAISSCKKWEFGKFTFRGGHF